MQTDHALEPVGSGKKDYMISKKEIMAVAGQVGLTPNIVEKDYVLGWLLAAISSNPALSQSWAFKGGTCLKKCYFETYRFSEDLDFTLKDENHLQEEFLINQFTSIASWLYEEAGIEILIDRLKFDIYMNSRGHRSCQGRVYHDSYFAQGKRDIPKIRLDLSADEVLVLPTSRQAVFHPYTDVPEGGIFIESYDYHEIFSEKVRALGERARPRDLYDVVNLFRHDHIPAPAIIRNILLQKCRYKKIPTPTLEHIEAFRHNMQNNWRAMLAHQLPALPALDVYWSSLPAFFDWLEGREMHESAQLTPIPGGEQVYQPPYGYPGLRTSGGTSLEIVRFAAGNRLCVNLDYTNNDGHRNARQIEPYSLRKTNNGELLLYAISTADRQIRSYRINQINDASITNEVFTPQYQVELSPQLSTG